MIEGCTKLQSKQYVVCSTIVISLWEISLEQIVVILLTYIKLFWERCQSGNIGMKLLQSSRSLYFRSFIYKENPFFNVYFPYYNKTITRKICIVKFKSGQTKINLYFNQKIRAVSNSRAYFTVYSPKRITKPKCNNRVRWCTKQSNLFVIHISRRGPKQGLYSTGVVYINHM